MHRSSYTLAILFLTVTICCMSVQKNTFSKTRLNHIAVRVSDLQKSTAFYQQVIGLDTIPEPFHDGRHTWFTLGNGAQLHLIQSPQTVARTDKNDHLCFSVPSVHDMMQQLAARGIPFSNWPGTEQAPTVRADGVKQIYFQDPDGNWIEINDDYR